MEMTSPSRSSSSARRLWHIVRLLFLGFSKNKLMVDLHLLLKRGKIAGKALTQLLTHHHHHYHHHHHHHHSHRYHHGGGGAASMYSALTCRSMDPDLAFYNPREVEFSCSNTPSYPTFRRHRRRHRRYDDDEDDAAFSKALEILYAEADIDDDAGGGEEEEEDYSALVAASTSPAIWKSPSAPVRQLRVTDSPFPLKEEEGEADGRIDQESEEFIKKFHEQLRLQQMISPVVAPEYMPHRRRRDVPLMMGRA